MARFQKGQPRLPNSGRRQGTPNKSTQDVQTFCRSLVEDPDYRQNLKERLTSGTLPPAMETMIWGYAWGRPIPQKSPDDLSFLQDFLAVVSSLIQNTEDRAKVEAVLRFHAERGQPRMALNGTAP